MSNGPGGRSALVLTFIASAVLQACSGAPSAEERADVGYDDGYAVGYNTACQIRSTLIDGDFGNEHYARAYSKGMEGGIQDCNRARENGDVE